ncbi:MAG: PH domain-containing protein [Ruminococcus sp.]|nr:PH domain-containing protein [Ruminococcus sp.]
MAKEEINYVWTDKKRTLFGLPLSFTRYYLTPTKFITRAGLFNVEEDEIDLYKIIDKSVQRPFFQRLFGCGTIVIHSKDADTPTKEVKSIKSVRQVSNLIDKHMNNMRDRYGIRGRDMVGVIPGDFADDVSVDSDLF